MRARSRSNWRWKAIHTTYRPLLHRCMQHRIPTLVVAALLFAGSLALVPVIGFSLFPYAGIPQFLVQMELPEGASLPTTDALSRRIEERLARFPFVASVQANIGRGNPQVYYNTGKLTAEVARRLQGIDLPSGFRFAFGGEVESSRESFGGIGSAIVVALFGVLAVLVLEFRSFRGTLIVASVIPLGVIGGVLALFLGGCTLSFVATVGFVALIGIEIKNSILLVDFTNQLRLEGVPLKEAIERAGEIRFLPVVLTTLTALGALFPVAVEGSAMFAPIAYVIISAG